MISQIKNKIKITDICRIAGLQVINNKVKSIYKDEKTPSLHIYPGGESFHDFSTGRGGDVIDFYMALYNLEKGTAIKDLSKLASLEGNYENRIVNKPLPKIERNDHLKAMSDDELYFYEERAALSSEAQALYEVKRIRLNRNIEIFEELFQYCQNFQDAKMFNDYLQNERMITPEFISKFRLFYIGNYFEVNNHLKKLFPIADLQRAGLVSDKGNLIFAKHRIIIPYLHNDKIIYLRGRYFDQDYNTVCAGSKYIGLKNDALGVNTAKRLYNLDTTTSMMDFERLYITEGEFDAIIAEQMGFNCIAIPGVGNLPGKMPDKLMRFQIIICADNDEAGKNLENNLSSYFNQMGKDVTIKNLNKKDITEFFKTYAD